jgi:glycosyltransferase involved in cell wall biosynthesis
VSHVPTVSVVIPLHNKAAYINETLLSLVAQRHESWEALVVENNSSDDGPERVALAAQKDHRIHLIDGSDRAIGPCGARNIGIAEASGEWVLFLDADDLIRDTHLESLLDMARVSGADLAVSDWLEFLDGEELAIANLDSVSGAVRKYAVGSSEDPKMLEETAIAYAPWAIHCAIIRRQILQGDRLWNLKLERQASEDTAFWFRIVTGLKPAFTKEPTALYRTETANYRNQYKDIRFWTGSVSAYLEENLSWLSACGASPSQGQYRTLFRLWESLAFESARLGETECYDKCLREARSWLNYCQWKDCPLSLKLRKCIGLQSFLKLQLLRKRLGRSSPSFQA